jgi:hypothetical protein
MERFKISELLDQNPQVDRTKVGEALNTLQELRKQGIARARYTLVSPYSRVASVEPVCRPEDPRTVRLKTNR